MRWGPQGLGGATPPLQAPGHGPQRAGGADDRRGCHAAGWGGTVAILHCAALEDRAAGAVILGRQAQPGAEVLVSGPLAHVRTDLGSEGLRQGLAHAVDGHEVYTGDAQDMGAGVARRGLLAVRVGLATWGRGGGWQGGRPRSAA
jgi:hypothetical protein